MSHPEVLLALVGGIVIGGSTAVVGMRWAMAYAIRRARRNADMRQAGR